jgi:type VI secretion system protein ImpF
MAREPTLRLRLSFLDRLLLDAEGEDDLSPMRELPRLHDAVRRDLESLLNSRRFCRSWPRSAGELDVSVLSFGLADIYSQPMATEAQREVFRATLEDAIRRFEPRFRSVTVTILKNTEEFDRTLRFRIQAVLTVDAEGEPVIYDSTLDPASRSFMVTDARGE